MMPTNLLLTSINWRAAIVKRFVKEFDQNPRIRGRIVTADTDTLAAGTYFGHKHYTVPCYVDHAYRDALHAILQKDKINLIIPNTDRDCRHFAGFQCELLSRGVRVLMPQARTVLRLNDKYETVTFLAEHNVSTPRTYTPDRLPAVLPYPLVIKPRKDSGSRHVFVAGDRKQLEAFLGVVREPVVQELIEGQEYTVDLLADFEENVVALVPRKRLGVKGGTAVKVVTCYDEPLIRAARQVASLLRLRGINCLQFIKHKSSGKLYFIEANPRMGSAVLASIEAGLNLPYLIHRLNNGEDIALPDDFFEDGLTMLYYHEPLYLRPGEVHAQRPCL